MKRQIAFVWLISGIALTLVPSPMFLKAGASASVVKTNSLVRDLSHLSELATIHAAGRGAPRINLADGREVLTAYAGDAEAQRLLQQNMVQPIAMASADFDEDGMQDLISAYAGPAEGIITLHRGNVDAMFPESPEANQRKYRGEFTDAPFLSPARVFRLPERPDFIGAGDFNSDNHADVILAARGGNSLCVLPGDGNGNFSSAVTVPISGRLTAMVTGSLNRRDGPTAVVVAVAAADGAKVLVLESSPALSVTESFTLPAEANALVLGHFDDDSETEVAVAAGNSLMILSAGATPSAVALKKPGKRSFPFAIKSLAAGDFTGNRRTELALLTRDGEVRVLSRPSRLAARIKDWSSEVITPVRFSRATRLCSARVSSLPLETLVLLDPAGHQVRLLTRERVTSTIERTATIEAALDADDQPVAVLPMRLNGDALSDLVVLNGGRIAPTIIPTTPSMTFTVNNTNDTGVGSLRAAIDQANTTPGPDLINFDLGAGTPTINVGTITSMALPSITEAVTINGNTGGATRVALNGTAAGAGADGLAILSTNTTVQALVINSFSGGGISIRQGPGNIIQGNFIGTDATGTSALPNASGGVLVAFFGNTIGGTVAQARNVISGNFSFGIAFNGVQPNNNFVQGNFIGTDLTGAAGLANGGGVATFGSASDNTIGGTGAGAGNVVAFNNALAGVAILGGTGNAVLGNSIFSNAALGIDLSDDGGITLNDDCDPDPGANNLQNFPVLTSASSAGGNTTIAGSLNSTPLTTFRVEFFSSNACDPSGNGEGQVFIGATNVATDNLCNAPINVSFPVSLAAGTVVTCAATDPSNNTSEFSACVTVTAGCSITCPASITRPNDPNLCGAVVTYPPPTTAGPCGTVTCAPASGSFFPKGTTTVTCNTVAGPSCAFNVTVNDTQPPTITCPANVIRSTDPNLCSAVVGYAAPTVSDNCPGATFTCAPPSGSTFAKGTTDVNCSATDTSANTTPCIFTVTVNDTQPPTLTCPPNQTVAANVPTVVNYPPPTAADNCPGVSTACNPPSGSTFPVGTTTVTCTATDTSGNTANCTFTVTVATCMITCPGDLLRFTSPTATSCGALVTFSATTSGDCGTVNCAPPSGSFFNVGTATVTCTTSAGPSCSFNITVIDNAPPSISCPAAISTTPLPGQTTAVVNYPPPTVTDNCPQPTFSCTPPSGSSFPIGNNIVTCRATDLSSNTSQCIFNIIVIDAEAPVIRCPANVNVVPPAGQTSAVVNYPPPTVSDNLPGATVVCVPASGTSFPAGTTTVTCTASDAQGNRASCSFVVSVGGPQLRVTIPGNRTSVEFATVAPTRKPPKPKNNPCSFFTVENIGFGPLTVTLDSIVRTGSDVDSGRITDTNDTRYFSLNRVGSDQSLTPLDIGGTIPLQPGQAQSICVKFAALLPATAGKTTGLAAANVLPDIVTSRIVFRQTAGANVFVPITARVATGLVLIDPINPRTPAVVGFVRNGNDITVTYSVFDSNLDVTRAKYEFLNSGGQATGESFEIDLTAAVRGLNLVKGQSFSVEQKFTGANSNAEIAGVRLTVFDGETNASSISSASVTPISAVSIQLMKRARAVTLYLPEVSLGPRLQ